MGGLAKLAPIVEEGAQWLGRSGEAALEREGPTGALMSKWIPQVLEKGELAAGPYVQRIREVLRGVPPLARDSIREQLDKGAMAPTPDLRAKGLELTQILDDHWSRAIKELGSNPRNKQPNYYPHMWEDGVFDPGAKRTAILESWVKQGKASSIADAEHKLQSVAGKGGRMYNLEMPRLKDLTGYRTDLEGVLVDHVSHANRRFAEAAEFGLKDEKLRDVISQAQKEGGNAELIDTILSHRIGRSIIDHANFKGYAHKSWENMLGSLQVARKLSLAVFNHPTQLLVNLPVKTGMSAAIRGVASAIADHGSAVDFSIYSAATGPEVKREMQREIAGTYEGIGSKVLGATRFYWFDFERRVMSSAAGKFAVQDEFTKLLQNPSNGLARRRLMWGGVDVVDALKNGKLSDTDIARYAKRISDTTQGRTNAFAIPIWWRSQPSHRMVMQFKPFFFNQARFLYKEVGVPAADFIKTGGKEGDIRPLMLFGLLAPTFGELNADLRYAVRGKFGERVPWKYPIDRLAEDIASVGSLGLYYDTVRALSGRTSSLFWQFLGGPALGDVVEGGFSMYGPMRRLMAGQPHPLDQLTNDAKQNLTRSVPVVGPAIANKMRKTVPKPTHHITDVLERVTGARLHF